MPAGSGWPRKSLSCLAFLGPFESNVEEGIVNYKAPVGQKMLLVDDEDFPILEVRELEIEGPSTDTD